MNTDFITDVKEKIRTGEASCVLCGENGILFLQKGRGIIPLMDIFTSHESDFAGGYVFDKAVGRAAASVLACAKVKYVFAAVMSEGGKRILEDAGIECDRDTPVPFILNPLKTGLCMLEKKIENEDTVYKCLEAVKEFYVNIKRSI